jgi:excisionase family DNA binding protein
VEKYERLEITMALYPQRLQPWYQDIDLLADGLANIKEAAHFLSIGRTKLYELLAKEELPHVKIGKASRIPKVALKIFALKG